MAEYSYITVWQGSTPLKAYRYFYYRGEWKSKTAWRKLGYDVVRPVGEIVWCGNRSGKYCNVFDVYHVADVELRPGVLRLLLRRLGLRPDCPPAIAYVRTDSASLSPKGVSSATSSPPRMSARTDTRSADSWWY